MKTKEAKQMIFRIIMAFMLLGVLLYASIVFSAEQVISIPDGDSTWKMTIRSQSNQSIEQTKSPRHSSDTLQVIPVQLTKQIDASRKAPLPPALPKDKVSATSADVTPDRLPSPSIQTPASLVPPEPVTNVPTYVRPTLSYLEIYRSIPFSRAEYLANPSYRHEATMEIMMGQLRPTVIHKTYRAKVQGSFPAKVPYRTHYRLPRRNRYGLSGGYSFFYRSR